MYTCTQVEPSYSRGSFRKLQGFCALPAFYDQQPLFLNPWIKASGAWACWASQWVNRGLGAFSWFDGVPGTSRGHCCWMHKGDFQEPLGGIEMVLYLGMKSLTSVEKTTSKSTCQHWNLATVSKRIVLADFLGVEEAQPLFRKKYGHFSYGLEVKFE